jgi:hypothetical protein
MRTLQLLCIQIDIARTISLPSWSQDKRRGAKMEMAGKDTDAEAMPLLVQHALVPVYHHIVNPYHSNYGEHVQLLKNFPM